MPPNGQYPNNPGRGQPKQMDLSMQVPLVCPGRTIAEGQAPATPCGTNVFAEENLVMYTRHRLKFSDRRFDSVGYVGKRYRCISCGHYLTKADYEGPIDPPKIVEENR